MCGLVGMLGNLDHKSKRIFKDMLDVCQVRGRDSTGAIKVGIENQDYTWAKRVGPPAYLFETKVYDDEIETGLASAYIGHCRHKTVGNVSTRTAHPFDYEDEGIVGVHNGTLRNYHNLDTYKVGNVDSEILYGHLAANGPDETFNKIEGAWACVWWNAENDTINFIRNKERPLYFTWSKDLKQMFWASETWMFGAVERVIDLWEGNGTTGRFIQLPVNTLWSFNIHPNAKGGKDPVVTMKPARMIEPKKPYVAPTKGNPKPWLRRQGSAASSQSTSKPLTQDEIAKRVREGWKDNGNGVWVRDNTLNTSTKGGEVTNPFLDDEMPDFLKGVPLLGKDTQAGSKPSSTEVKKSTTNSSNSLVVTTPSTHSSNSEKQTKSPLPSNSTNSQKTNRSVLSVVSTPPQEKQASQTCQRRKTTGVSHRTVAGMEYITDNITGREFSEEEFEKKTDGICCHCKEPIGSLKEVSDIFDEDSFLCVPCTQFTPKLETVSNKKEKVA